MCQIMLPFAFCESPYNYSKTFTKLYNFSHLFIPLKMASIQTHKKLISMSIKLNSYWLLLCKNMNILITKNGSILTVLHMAAFSSL